MTTVFLPSPLVAAALEPGPGAGAVALRAGSTLTTYAELRHDVLALVEALRRAGVRPGDRIALALPKGIGCVQLILAALAAGAVYVPLDCRLPLRQLLRILDDVEPVLVIAERGHAVNSVAQGGSRQVFGSAILAGSTLELLTPVPRSAERSLSPEGLAAILYTSGSTGEPKGIMLTHGNIASFVEWAAETFAISPQDRLANHAPFHFDLSIFDLFCGLTRHASVHLLDEASARFAGAVRSFIDSGGITVWYSVPTALAQLQERRALLGISSIRLVLFAGEVFPVPALRRLMADLPRPEYANLYGPTETNVCTYHRLPGPPGSDLDSLPIGRPCEHLQVSLRGPEGVPVAVGETGEICVEGAAVMDGYWRRPELTRAARLPGRAASYRTGDYGWYRAEGEIMFAGRRDQQVKVRGHRIELLALEAVLNAHPDVREAVALALPDHAGDLLAAVLVAEREPISIGELRRFVADRLASYYQPDRILFVPAMPRTATGKCDRVTLRTVAASVMRS
jgi:amino acid adenylation domain-containing protein